MGIYGVLSYLVTQRTREIGIRVALGANAIDVFRAVAGPGMTLAAIGIAIGIAGALALSRLLTTLLFGVRPTDPATYAAADCGIRGSGIARLLLSGAARGPRGRWSPCIMNSFVRSRGLGGVSDCKLS